MVLSRTLIVAIAVSAITHIRTFVVVSVHRTSLAVALTDLPVRFASLLKINFSALRVCAICVLAFGCMIFAKT